MFNRDALFGRKDENPHNNNNNNEPRSVNVTPSLNASPTMRPQTEAPKTDLRFAEPARAAPAPRTEEASGSKLIVGPDITLKGVEISNCDTLVVEGRVEAAMDSRVVQIAENGVFSGTVSIDVAEIRGHFEGELTARKQLVIFSTGRVSGKIRYGKIRIEEGGELSGDIATLAAAAPAQPAVVKPVAVEKPAQPEPVQTAPQPAVKAAQQQPQPSAQPASQAAQQSSAPQQQATPQKSQATVAAASSAEKPRYEPLPRSNKSGKPGVNAS